MLLDRELWSSRYTFAAFAFASGKLAGDDIIAGTSCEYDCGPSVNTVLYGGCMGSLEGGGLLMGAGEGLSRVILGAIRWSHRTCPARSGEELDLFAAAN